MSGTVEGARKRLGTSRRLGALGTLAIGVLGAALSLAAHGAPQVQTPGFYLSTIGSTLEEVRNDPFTPEGDFTGLLKATSFAFAERADAVFVAEKDGRVRVIVDGVLQIEPVVEMTDQVANYIDRGIGGIDVHPDFPLVKEIVIAYTHENGVTGPQGPKYAKVARLRLREERAADGGVEYFADAPTEADVILGKLSATPEFPSCNDRPLGADCGAVDHGSHSFTFVRYGPDRKIYVGTGDGAGFYSPDPHAFYAMRNEHLSGKILRIDIDGTGPSDNPFFTGNPNDNASKVFARGLRNPKSGAFNPATGQFCVGNVGWYLNEGIYCLDAGENAGWPCRENGPARNGYETLSLSRDGERLGSCPLPPGTWVEPVYAYPHEPRILGDEELFLGAVIGCAVPDSPEYPADFNGSCVFGDYVFDTLSSVRLNDGGGNPSSVLQVAEAGKPTDVDTDRSGNVCFIAYEVGTVDGTPVSEIRCLRHDASGSVQRYPVVSFITSPDPALPSTLNFDASSSYHTGGETLSYMWDFGDGNTAAGVRVRHIYATHGDYTVTLEVSAAGESVRRSSSQVVRITDPDFTTPVLPSVEGIEYASDEHFVSSEVDFGVRVRNDRGDEPFRVIVNIYDEAGKEIVHLDDRTLVQIEAGETETIPFVWEGTGSPGEYRMNVEFYAMDYGSWNLKYPGVSNLVVRNRVGESIEQGRPITSPGAVDPVPGVDPEAEPGPTPGGESESPIVLADESGGSSGGGAAGGASMGALVLVLLFRGRRGRGSLSERRLNA